ncbi:MAG: hypothetical protein R2695_06675 [Acidimicrobiales bacterium]
MPKPLNGVRIGPAHPSVTVQGRGELVPRRRRPLRMVDHGAAVHGRGAPPCPRITAVTNQLVNSYKRIAETSEAPPYVAWPATTGRRWCASRSARRASPVGPHRVPGARSRLQPLPGLLAAPVGGHARDHRGLRAPGRDQREPVRPRRRGAGSSASSRPVRSTRPST